MKVVGLAFVLLLAAGLESHPKARLQVAVAPTLPRIVAEGQHFRLADGTPFTAIEGSDFALYQRYLDGQPIQPILKQRRDAGFNLLRVFGSFNGTLGRFVPASYGDEYFTRLPGFYQELAQAGLYGEFTVFADATRWIAQVSDQVAHFNRVVDAIRPITNAILEVVNEADQAINRLDGLAQLQKPAGVFTSHGSNGSQATPVAPYWDYITFHTNGAPEEQRKIGQRCMELWTGPCLTNETSRGGDMYRSPAFAYDAAAGAALLAAGSAFHSVSGRSSRHWTAEEEALARQWAAGSRSVPLGCQAGGYRHRDDLKGPGLLRVYQRGNDPACIVRIRD